MLLILTAWCAILLVCVGIESVWVRITRCGTDDRTFIERLLVGFCLVAGSSSVLSIFFPLKSSGIKYLLMMLGVAGLASLILYARRHKKLHLIVALLSFLVLCVYIAWPLASAASCTAYDTLLYHYQQVQWLRSEGTPLGLGTLHSRLGMPTTFLSMAALFEHGQLARRSAWIMPALFPLVAALWCVGSVRRAFNDRDSLTLCYSCAVFPFLFIKLSTLEPSLYFDDAAGIVQLIVVGECARLLGISSTNEVLIKSLKGRILTLAAFSVTVKLSALTIAVCALGYCLSIHRRTRPPLGFIITAGLLITAYAIRSAMLTGWMFFPIPFGQLPVSWAIPAGVRYDPSDPSFVATTETVYGNIQVISAWAKLPGPQFTRAITEGVSAWWPQWRDQFASSFYYKMLCVASIAAVMRLALITKKSYMRDVLFLLAFGALPLAYWFCSAPDLRFASVNFWITTAVSLAVVLQHLNMPRGAVIALAMLFIIVEQRSIVPRHGTPRWVKPGVAQALPTQQITLSSGSTVYIPATPGEDRCGHSRRPCTPYVKQNLQISTTTWGFVKFALMD